MLLSYLESQAGEDVILVPRFPQRERESASQDKKSASQDKKSASRDRESRLDFSALVDELKPDMAWSEKEGATGPGAVIGLAKYLKRHNAGEAFKITYYTEVPKDTSPGHDALEIAESASGTPVKLRRGKITGTHVLDEWTRGAGLLIVTDVNVVQLVHLSPDRNAGRDFPCTLADPAAGTERHAAITSNGQLKLSDDEEHDIVELISVHQVPLCLTKERITWKECSEWIEEEKQKEDDLHGSVDLGFSGDEAGDDRLFKLNVKVSMQSHEYPNQLRMDAGAMFQLKDDEIQEDLTKFRFSWDHYYKERLEGFTFVERFSDSFLSIKQRYELGVGLKYEWRKRNIPDDVLDGRECEDVHIHEKRTRLTKKGGERLRALQRLHEESPPTPTDRLSFEDYCKYRNGIQSRYAKFQMGISASAFAEFEQAEIEATITRLEPAEDDRLERIEEKRKVTTPAEQVFRLALRPSFVFRPTDEITLRGRYYWKISLSDSSDVREDGALSMEISRKGSESMSLEVALERHTDSEAPRLGPAERRALSEEIPGFRNLSDTVAEDTHWVYRMAIKIKWK